LLEAAASLFRGRGYARRLMTSGQHLGYVWSLTEAAAAHADNMEAAAVPEIVLEAKAAP
jgi:hypothetical protein